MALPDINTVKELTQTYQPLLLADIVWDDGTELHLSTHAVTYNSNAYLPRLIGQQLAPLQGRSEQGISVTPTVTLRCADADAWLYTNYEAALGFKGATLTLTFVYWNVGSADFSSDSIVKFIGRCGSPQIDDKSISIPALNKYNLAPYNLPSLAIQPTCPWIFPINADLGEASANGSNQQSKECPYNPSGVTNPRGNLNPSTSQPYTSCGKTKGDCQDRGMYTTDSASRKTGCFGGIQFNPPTSQLSRSYETSKWQQILNTGPEAKYGDVVPLFYGEGWVQGKVLNMWPDANYTRMEVLLSYGKIGQIFKVLVNNEEIPHVFGDPVCATTPADVTTTAAALRIGWWQGVNDGSVYSAPGSAYKGAGDPYGSLAVLYIQVVNQIAGAQSVPNVQVLLQGQQVRVYSSPTSFVTQWSDNPWWIILDLLSWVNLEYSDVDLAGFLAQAAYAAEAISYISQFGDSRSHSRFAYTLYLLQRQPADQILFAALNGVRGFLVPNYLGGLLSPRTARTLGDQQGAAVDGSNYNTAVGSFDSAGDALDGYWAYYFQEGTIAEDEQGNTTLKISQATIQQAPNRLSAVFQDAENTFTQDSLSVSDDEDVALTGQVIPGNVQVSGPNTYDHLQRIFATRLSEMYRGNHRLAVDGATIGDTRGTISITFQTSHRVVKLALGDIVGVDSVKYGWTGQSFRIRQLEPNPNGERVTVTADFHNDGWYIDSYGQTGAKPWTSGWRSPNVLGARPLTQLGLAPVKYSTVGGATHAALTVYIAPGVNTPDGTLQPPFVPIQSLTANTGGTVPGGLTYYLALVAANSTGLSKQSLLTKVFVPAGTNTNTITIPNLFWDATTTGFLLYAGIAPDRLNKQTGNYTTTGGTGAKPASTTLTGALVSAGELPDDRLSFVRFKSKFMYLPGIWTGALASASFSSGVWTLGLEVGAGPAFGTNALVDRQIVLLGRATSVEADIHPLVLPVAYPSALTITANTATTITVSGDSTGVVAFAPGDQITIRLAATIGSDGGGNYISDALLINPNRPFGLSSTEVSAGDSLIRIIAGTGTGLTVHTKSNTATKIYILGAWPITPDATSIFVVEDSGWDTISDTSRIYNDGSLGVLAYSFDVSSFTGQTVLIEAVAVGADGTESSEISAPVREAYLLAQGAAIDSTEPPLFSLSIDTDYRGNFVLTNVGPVLDSSGSPGSYNTVEHATLHLFTWDLSKVTPDWILQDPMGASDSTMTVTTAGLAPYVGQLLVLNSELVSVVSVSGTTFDVIRASLSSVAAGHPIGTGVFALDSSAIQLSFAPLFFTSVNAAAASIYQQKVQSPNTILCGAQFYATNDIGNGPVNHFCFAGVTPTGHVYGLPNLPDGGLIAGLGGIADTFGVQGTLAIGANLATPYQRDTITLPRQIVAQVRQAPSGGAITININYGGALYQTVVIPDSAVIQILEGPLPPLPANAVLTIDVLGVGSTFPGADLGITIYG